MKRLRRSSSVALSSRFWCAESQDRVEVRSVRDFPVPVGEETSTLAKLLSLKAHNSNLAVLDRSKDCAHEVELDLVRCEGEGKGGRRVEMGDDRLLLAFLVPHIVALRDGDRSCVERHEEGRVGWTNVDSLRNV